MPRPNLQIAAFSCLLACLAGAGHSAEAVTVHRNLQYATVGDLPLRLDLYVPKKSGATPPLVVWIHGGGWRQGSKDNCRLAWMTEHGYAVASVQYRLTDKAAFPAQIHDCKGAIRWLRSRADKFGYDASKIGVAGISAGGHLVALLGTSGGVKALEGEVGGNLDCSSRVQAVLDMCGPSDFLLRLKKQPHAVEPSDSPVARLLGGPASKNEELARTASPAHHVTKDDPPLLIFHGTKDPLVHPRQSKHLRDLYLKADLQVALELIPDGGHVPKEFWDETRREMTLKFFARHLRGDG